MSASKLILAVLLISQALSLIACDTGHSIATGADDAQVDPNSTGVLCTIEGYDLAARSANDRKIERDLTYHVNTLSGAAAQVFNSKLPSAKIFAEEKGLSQVCSEKSLALEISCEGKISVITNGKTDQLTHDQLLALSPLYVKSAFFCNGFELKKNESLFVVVDQLSFQNLTIKQATGSLLSFSANSLLSQSQDLKNIEQERGSALMIHAHSAN